MKTTIIATLAALTLAAPAFAGGPVIITEEPEVTAPRREIGALPIILGVLIIGALIASGGSDNCVSEPVEPKPDAGGC